MPDKSAASAVDAIFNRRAVADARARKLLRSWMEGSDDYYPGTTKSEQEIEEEEKGIFTIESEIAGLGAPAEYLNATELSGLETFGQVDDASTAFLRERMMSKGRKAARTGASAAASRPTISLPGVVPGFVPGRTATPTANAQDAGANAGGISSGSRPPAGATAPVSDDDDDEDEIGRSGLGSKPRKTSTGKTSALSEGAFGGQEQQDLEEGADQAVEPERDPNSVEPPPAARKEGKKTSKKRAVSYLDEILAQKEAKRKKKKKHAKET